MSPEEKKAKAANASKRYRKRHPGRVRARAQVFIALRAGLLKKEPCFCGAPAEAHHPNYRKPLAVEWLCKKHHVEREKQ